MPLLRVRRLHVMARRRTATQLDLDCLAQLRWSDLAPELRERLGALLADLLQQAASWQGDRHTQLVLPRNRTGQHRRSTDRAVVDVVRDLARAQSDGDIARVLNRLGYRTGAGNTWTALRILSLRRYHGVKDHVKLPP